MNEYLNIDLNNEEFFSKELLNVDSGNSYLRNWLEVKRDCPVAVTGLVLKQDKADVFAIKIMKKAMHFNITNAVIDIAEELPRYLLFNGDVDSVKYYTKVVEKYRTIRNAELKAKMFSVEINGDFVRKVKSETLLDKLNQFLSELDELSQTIKSYTFEMYYYELQKKRFELKQDEPGILKLCSAAVAKMNEKRFKVVPQVLFAFSYPQIPILIKQRNFAAAKKIISKWSRQLRKDKNDWFVVHSYYVIMNFRKMDIKKVKYLLSNVKKYPTDLVRERYELFNAYASLFDKRVINPARFVNDVYEHQKDKSGYKIPIVIAQLMHLLKIDSDSSRTKYIESVEAIDRYLYRSIKDDPRSSLFLKMLLMIPKCDFEKEKFLEKSRGHFVELKGLPMEEYSRSVEIEMVGYERLYERVLDFLK